jgi:anaerobic selenocysteine-containing dehydrogenase
MSLQPKAPVVTRGACPHDCPDTCAMLYTVEDGKVVDVRGDPDHPITRGGLCIKMKDFARHHYLEGRVLHPMRRVGPKGSAQFERITWGEALHEIRHRWTGIIDRHGAEAIMSYNYLGHLGLLNGLQVGDAFFNKLGASVSEKTFCTSGSCTAYLMTVGPTGGVDGESFELAQYIVLWGLNSLSTNLHHWPVIEKARERGAKIVVVDPVATRTAKAADWHIMLRPGSDAALALGMMNVIIEEGLVDQDYVDRYCHGYDDLKERCREYPVERVAELTGVPAEDIRRFAREYATAVPQVIRLGVGLEKNACGGQSIRAVSCLPGLVGAWRHPGGGLLEMSLWSFPMKGDEICRPDYIRPGTRVLEMPRIADILNDRQLDPPLMSMMVYNANPMSQSPDQNLIRKGLMRDDFFLVVSEHFVTDTARYADILLPAAMQAEQDDLMPSWGHFFWTYNQKSIEPAGEAVSNTELFRRLADTMGFAESHWQRTDEQLMRDFIDWDAPVMKGASLEKIRERGYWRLDIGDPMTRTPHAEGNFPTPTGKCEFKTTQADKGNFVVPAWRSGYNELQPGQPVDPLPAHAPLHESRGSTPGLAAHYPLNLISPKPHAFLNSQHANDAIQKKRQGEQSIIIHRDDADAMGIADGQMVRVFNDRGSFTGRASVGRDVMPGAVCAPSGYWASHSGSGTSVNAVTSTRLSDLGNAPTFSDVLVRVEPLTV